MQQQRPSPSANEHRPSHMDAPAGRPALRAWLFGRDASAEAARPVLSAGTRDTREPGGVLRYGVSFLCAVGATALTLFLWQPVFSRNPFALFYAAVMLSAWYGGLGPGLVATVFSVLAIDTFLLPSFVTAFPGSQELVQVGIFGGVALLISSLNATGKRAIAERDRLIALEQSARADAEQARRRSALLADVSNVLGGSLDSPAAVGAVAERAVPEFADWCLIDVADEVPDGGGDDDAPAFHRLAVAHADPRRQDAARHLLGTFDSPAHPGGVARVIRTGKPEVMTRASAEWLADIAGRDPSMAAFASLGAASYLIVPLHARGRTLGAISFLSTDPARGYEPYDLRLAEDLAHRLAFALDNAQLYRAAQQASRTKDEFLAVVSHELRTPLNAILGWAQLLNRAGMDEPSFAQGMSAIERNARSQARIIDDVLDVSRITQGKLHLDARPVELRRIIEDALDVVRPAAEAKRILLRARFATSDDRLPGDPERLRQVIWNLLSNAVKFTPEGGHVDVTLSRDDGGGGHLELRVHDTGRGIDPRFLPYVFERFRQADSSSTRAHGGLGLGLAIVRHLVECHGGTVAAQSDGDGRGATFIVRLPTDESAPVIDAGDNGDSAGAEMPGVPAMAAPSDGRLAGLRVLLVDDERDARELFSSVLERCGAEVTAVATVPDALDAFSRRRPDVLLSDIGMPGQDGYALIRAVRAIEDRGPSSCPPTPAMAITAFARAEDRRRALREGYQMHVPKPVEPGDFAAAVAALAAHKHARATAPSGKASAEIQIPPTPPLSPAPRPL
jgi:signal transduction histidine kinase/DNA-binding NarL/FixJ family response regulator